MKIFLRKNNRVGFFENIKIEFNYDTKISVYILNDENLNFKNKILPSTYKVIYCVFNILYCTCNNVIVTWRRRELRVKRDEKLYARSEKRDVKYLPLNNLISKAAPLTKHILSLFLLLGFSNIILKPTVVVWLICGNNCFKKYS